MIIYIFIFIFSCILLFWAGSRLVDELMQIARYLGWREFVVAFFVMAFACSLPNLFVGIDSALHKIPQLSFGDIVGGNVINLTLVAALAVLVGRGSLPAESRMVQLSTLFSVFTAILPLFLILDGELGRLDGIVLILIFVVYVAWLFSKEERFKKAYNGQEISQKPISSAKDFFTNVGQVILFLGLLLLAAEGIVISAQSFSIALGVGLPIIGMLFVAFGNTLPEMYFSIVSARKGQTWMILGDLVGSVIYTSSLVLGIIALICPIRITDFSPFFIARIFLIISALLFLISIRSGQKITKKEGVILLIIYILFVASVIYFK